MYFKVAQLTKHLGYFCKKICHHEHSKIVQSCHTAINLNHLLSLPCEKIWTVILTILNFFFELKTALSLSPSNELLFYASETNKIAQLSTPHRDASVTFATRCLYVSYLDKYLMESRPLQKPSHFYDFSSTGFRERATAAFCRHLRTKWEVFWMSQNRFLKLHWRWKQCARMLESKVAK